jgi:hypothetical protein
LTGDNDKQTHKAYNLVELNGTRKTNDIQEVPTVRKVLILFLSAVLVLPLLLLLPGCGGDTSKANTYIENGDAYADKLPTQGKDLGTALTDFFNTLIGPNPESVAKSGGPLDKYYSALYVSMWLANNAKPEYARVLDLHDAQDQKTYADMMVKILNKDLALMEFIKVWFGNALNVIITRNPTRIKDYLTGTEFVNGQNQITVMKDELDKLVKDATDYRKSKNF